MAATGSRLLVAGYAAGALFVYGGDPFRALGEVFRIPIIEYALAFSIALITLGLMGLITRIRRGFSPR